MNRTIATGIDVGTTAVKVIVSEYVKTDQGPERRIIGTGACESVGLRHGYIIDSGQVTRSVRDALAQAEKTARIKIRDAVISVGGAGLESHVATGSSIISRADSEITTLDVQNALDACHQALPDTAKFNRKVIHTIPLSYKLDGKEIMGRVVGMRGVKLEAKTLFVTILEQHFADLVEAVEAADVEVRDVCAAPIAAAVATLSKAQRIAGCVLADIGAETVSIVVYEDDTPTSVRVFPIGSDAITHDIALGLRIPLDEAERIKTGVSVPLSHPKKKLDEIITARLKDIFELIEAHLKKLGKNGLLPAGIILVGGGARISGIEELAKGALALPARNGNILIPTATHGAEHEPSWTTAYGLALLGLTPGASSGSDLGGGMRFTFLKTLGSKLAEMGKKLLP